MKVKVRKRSLEELMYTHPFESEDENTWKNENKAVLDDFSEMEEIDDHEEEDLENKEDSAIDWEEKYNSLLTDYINVCIKLEALELKVKDNEDTLTKYKFACEDLSNKLDEKEISADKLQELFDWKITHAINSICCCVHNTDDACKINARYNVYDLIKYIIKYIDFFKA